MRSGDGALSRPPGVLRLATPRGRPAGIEDGAACGQAGCDFRWDRALESGMPPARPARFWHGPCEGYGRGRNRLPMEKDRIAVENKKTIEDKDTL